MCFPLVNPNVRLKRLSAFTRCFVIDTDTDTETGLPGSRFRNFGIVAALAYTLVYAGNMHCIEIFLNKYNIRLCLMTFDYKFAAVSFVLRWLRSTTANSLLSIRLANAYRATDGEILTAARDAQSSSQLHALSYVLVPPYSCSGSVIYPRRLMSG